MLYILDCAIQRFNTQPPEGGWGFKQVGSITQTGFNTQPPEGGWSAQVWGKPNLLLFQHTAARRRLEYQVELLTD